MKDLLFVKKQKTFARSNAISIYTVSEAINQLHHHYIKSLKSTTSLLHQASAKTSKNGLYVKIRDFTPKN